MVGHSLAINPAVVSETMLKIERSENGEVLLRLYGRIEIADLVELEQLVNEEAKRPFAIDLKGVTLVDREVIRFLTCCEARTIELRNCPRYIREWMQKDQGEAK
jgi:hypothetical protein